MSAATWRAASACHFTTSSHACFGLSPSRPPMPFVVWKPSITPSLEGGMPIARKSSSPFRIAWRRVRFATIGPAL